MLYYNKNPAKLKHCEMSSSYRVFNLMKLKPQKEGYYLILKYDYVTWKPRKLTNLTAASYTCDEIEISRVGII